MEEKKIPPQEEQDAPAPYTPASPVKRTMAWIGVVYMVILVAMMTYYYFTGSMLVNMAPLLAVPGLIGLGILALVSWRTTGRPGKWPAIALAAVCFLAALATLPLGIVGLLSNFSLVGVFVTGAPGFLEERAMRDIIAAGLADLGLLDRVPEQAPSQLAEYGHLLLEKNQVMNLTAITDPVKVAQLHMLDCAALLTCADFENRALLDVGTGAGFPGLPLKILVPSLQVTLLDSLNKRVDWLAQVSAQLSLTGIRVIHARAEEQALEKGFRDSFELVTARAVAELRLLCELCLPYVKVGGAFLAMKSVDCGRELEEAAHCIKLLGARLEECRDYTIPGTDVIHRLVVLRKVAPTLKGYPRRWAKIQKAPL